MLKAILVEVRVSFKGTKRFFGIVQDAPEDIYVFPDSNGDLSLHELRMYDPACTEDDYFGNRPVEVQIPEELKPFTKDGVVWCACFNPYTKLPGQNLQ